MTTIKEKAVEYRGKSSDTKNSSGNLWEGGNRMTVGARVCVGITSSTYNVRRLFPHWEKSFDGHRCWY
jgi:hypothetical protein